MHSTFSDGVLPPAELVERAAALGVTMMAITDHDTFAGVETLRDVQTPIPVITGVELSPQDMHGLHLLGYGKAACGELRHVVEDLAGKRQRRAEQMIQRLNDLGMPLDWAEMTSGYSGTVGRAHIARAMLARGYISTMQEAFDKYLSEGRPAYVAGERLTMAQALPLMRSCGFVPVLAHPVQLDKDEVTLRTLMAHWKDQGLMGMEVYHPSQMNLIDQYRRMARSLGLLITGGSDYHKDHDSHGAPGCTASAWSNARQDVEALLEAL